jgi:hypothetical protein
MLLCHCFSILCAAGGLASVQTCVYISVEAAAQTVAQRRRYSTVHLYGQVAQTVAQTVRKILSIQMGRFSFTDLLTVGGRGSAVTEDSADLRPRSRVLPWYRKDIFFLKTHSDTKNKTKIVVQKHPRRGPVRGRPRFWSIDIVASRTSC